MAAIRDADRPTAAPPWHSLRVSDVTTRLATSSNGLSAAEATARRAVAGPNEIGEERATPLWTVIVEQFRSPLIYILVGAAIITLLLGEHLDAAVITTVLALNATIGAAQQRKAETSVRALQQLVTPRAHVVRGGHEHEIDSRDVVPGDVVLLERGVRVPADLRLARTTALMVDESLLTGESLPVAKSSQAVAADAGLADRTSLSFAGTVVTTGRGLGYVVATGSRTELGQIAEHVRTGATPTTPLQQRLDRFAQRIGILVVAAAATAFATGVALGDDPAEMFAFAVALAVSAVPEGLPVVFTVALAVGVVRMARRRAIIRRLPAVETLGSTTVICSDKTGTLTQNRMSVRELRTATGRFVVDGDASDGQRLDTEAIADHREVYLTLLAGVLASEAEVFETDGQLRMVGDPTETAVVAAAVHAGLEPWSLRAEHPRLDHVPFEPERRYAAVAARMPDGDLVMVQGAPERVLAMCDTELVDGTTRRLQAAAVTGAAREMADAGLRVLAFAGGPATGEHATLPSTGHPTGLTFLGLQGMADPPRPGVREAVTACHDAGIRVVMVTGDHAGTATAVARETGIATSPATVGGQDLDGLDDEQLRAAARETHVFARVAPEHKLRIVQALRSDGEVVAVTGDGVNDAPALQAADIGVAMGASGTDVAREAADMVLADDNFITIRAAVEQGRITFDNLRKVTFFLISTGAAEVVMLLTALSLRWPLVLVPAQLLWLNLVTNGLQDVALAFEPGEPDVLRRRPRRRRDGLVSALLWERTVLVALVMAAGTLLIFQWTLRETGSLQLARTAAMTTMVLCQVVHVGNSRMVHRSVFSSPPWGNRFLLASVAAALALHATALHVPATQWVLRVEPLPATHWMRGAVVALAVLAVVEVHKAIRRPKADGEPPRPPRTAS